MSPPANQFHLRRLFHQSAEPEFHQKNLILLDGMTKFGRNPDYVDVVLNSAVHSCSNMISRKHANITGKLNSSGTAFEKYVIDDHSLNGTYINDQRVSGTTELRLGDVVKFGHMNGAAIKAGQTAPQAHAEFAFVVERALPNFTYLGFTPSGKRVRGLVCKGNQDRLFLVGDDDRKDVTTTSAHMPPVSSSGAGPAESMIPSATATTPLATAPSMMNWSNIPPNLNHLHNYQYILPFLQNQGIMSYRPPGQQQNLLPEEWRNVTAFNAPPLSSASSLLQFQRTPFTPFDLSVAMRAHSEAGNAPKEAQHEAAAVPAVPSPPMECDSSVPSPPKPTMPPSTSANAIDARPSHPGLSVKCETKIEHRGSPKIIPHSTSTTPSPASSEKRRLEEEREAKEKRRREKEQRKLEKKEKKKERDEERERDVQREKQLQRKKEEEREQEFLKERDRQLEKQKVPKEPEVDKTRSKSKQEAHASEKHRLPKKSNELAHLLNDLTEGSWMQRAAKDEKTSTVNRRRSSAEVKKERPNEKKQHRLMKQLSVSESDESCDSDSEPTKKRRKTTDSDSDGDKKRKKKIVLKKKEKNMSVSVSWEATEPAESSSIPADSGELCALGDKCSQPRVETINWIQCEGCEAWFHTLCYFKTVDTPAHMEGTDFYCNPCKNAGKMRKKKRTKA